MQGNNSNSYNQRNYYGSGSSRAPQDNRAQQSGNTYASGNMGQYINNETPSSSYPMGNYQQYPNANYSQPYSNYPQNYAAPNEQGYQYQQPYGQNAGWQQPSQQQQQQQQPDYYDNYQEFSDANNGAYNDSNNQMIMETDYYQQPMYSNQQPTPGHYQPQGIHANPSMDPMPSMQGLSLTPGNSMYQHQVAPTFQSQSTQVAEVEDGEIVSDEDDSNPTSSMVNTVQYPSRNRRFEGLPEESFDDTMMYHDGFDYAEMSPNITAPQSWNPQPANNVNQQHISHQRNYPMSEPSVQRRDPSRQPFQPLAQQNQFVMNQPSESTFENSSSHLIYGPGQFNQPSQQQIQRQPGGTMTSTHHPANRPVFQEQQPQRMVQQNRVSSTTPTLAPSVQSGNQAAIGRQGQFRSPMQPLTQRQPSETRTPQPSVQPVQQEVNHPTRREQTQRPLPSVHQTSATTMSFTPVTPSQPARNRPTVHQEQTQQPLPRSACHNQVTSAHSTSTTKVSEVTDRKSDPERLKQPAPSTPNQTPEATTSSASPSSNSPTSRPIVQREQFKKPLPPSTQPGKTTPSTSPAKTASKSDTDDDKLFKKPFPPSVKQSTVKTAPSSSASAAQKTNQHVLASPVSPSVASSQPTTQADPAVSTQSIEHALSRASNQVAVTNPPTTSTTPTKSVVNTSPFQMPKKLSSPSSSISSNAPSKSSLPNYFAKFTSPSARSLNFNFGGPETDEILQRVSTSGSSPPRPVKKAVRKLDSQKPQTEQPTVAREATPSSSSSAKPDETLSFKSEDNLTEAERLARRKAAIAAVADDPLIAICTVEDDELSFGSEEDDSDDQIVRPRQYTFTEMRELGRIPSEKALGRKYPPLSSSSSDSSADSDQPGPSNQSDAERRANRRKQKPKKGFRQGANDDIVDNAMLDARAIDGSNIENLKSAADVVDLIKNSRIYGPPVNPPIESVDAKKIEIALIRRVLAAVDKDSHIKRIMELTNGIYSVFSTIHDDALRASESIPVEHLLYRFKKFIMEFKNVYTTDEVPTGNFEYERSQNKTFFCIPQTRRHGPDVHYTEFQTIGQASKPLSRCTTFHKYELFMLVDLHMLYAQKFLLPEEDYLAYIETHRGFLRSILMVVFTQNCDKRFQVLLEASRLLDTPAERIEVAGILFEKEFKRMTAKMNEYIANSGDNDIDTVDNSYYAYVMDALFESDPSNLLEEPELWYTVALGSHMNDIFYLMDEWNIMSDVITQSFKTELDRQRKWVLDGGDNFWPMLSDTSLWASFLGTRVTPPAKIGEKYENLDKMLSNIKNGPYVPGSRPFASTIPITAQFRKECNQYSTVLQLMNPLDFENPSLMKFTKALMTHLVKTLFPSLQNDKNLPFTDRCGKKLKPELNEAAMSMLVGFVMNEFLREWKKYGKWIAERFNTETVFTVKAFPYWGMQHFNRFDKFKTLPQYMKRSFLDLSHAGFDFDAYALNDELRLYFKISKVKTLPGRIVAKLMAWFAQPKVEEKRKTSEAVLKKVMPPKEAKSSLFLNLRKSSEECDVLESSEVQPDYGAKTLSLPKTTQTFGKRTLAERDTVSPCDGPAPKALLLDSLDLSETGSELSDTVESRPSSRTKRRFKFCEEPEETKEDDIEEVIAEPIIRHLSPSNSSSNLHKFDKLMASEIGTIEGSTAPKDLQPYTCPKPLFGICTETHSIIMELPHVFKTMDKQADIKNHPVWKYFQDGVLDKSDEYSVSHVSHQIYTSVANFFQLEYNATENMYRSDKAVRTLQKIRQNGLNNKRYTIPEEDLNNIVGILLPFDLRNHVLFKSFCLINIDARNVKHYGEPLDLHALAQSAASIFIPATCRQIPVTFDFHNPEFMESMQPTIKFCKKLS